MKHFLLLVAPVLFFALTDTAIHAQTPAPHGTPSPVPHVAPRTPNEMLATPAPTATPITEFGIQIQGETVACERVTRGTAAVLNLSPRIEWFCYKP